jgi:predicted transposase/invertase (TIGR01784 family)
MGLRLVNDFIFLYVFGREETKNLLLDLVNAVLIDADCPTIQSLELKNPVNLRDSFRGKETVLDLRAVADDNRQFDVEMQVTRHPAFVNRSLYYWSQLYSGELERGQSYVVLRPAVCINLLDFVLFPDTQANHHRFMVSDVKNHERILTEDLQIHYVELTKASARDTKLNQWVELLENAGKEGADMDVVLSRSYLLQRAYEEFERCTQDDYIRELALSRERFQRDLATDLDYAQRDGLAKGLEQGLEQGIEQGIKQGMEKGLELARLEDARRFKGLGVSVKVISKATGLSEEIVEAL